MAPKKQKESKEKSRKRKTAEDAVTALSEPLHSNSKQTESKVKKGKKSRKETDSFEDNVRETFEMEAGNNVA